MKNGFKKKTRSNLPTSSHLELHFPLDYPKCPNLTDFLTSAGEQRGGVPRRRVGHLDGVRGGGGRGQGREGPGLHQVETPEEQTDPGNTKEEERQEEVSGRGRHHSREVRGEGEERRDQFGV